MNRIEDIKQRVGTFPLERGGSNFKTHYLIEEDTTLKYKPTALTLLFCILIPLIGITLLIYQLVIKEGTIFDLNWVVIIISLFLVSCGFSLLNITLKAKIFDKSESMYYGNLFRKSSTNSFPLKQIVAVQIIGEHVESDNGSFKSFELNLVLENCSRRNVIDYNNLRSIIRDANIISSFLNVPIWHATSYLEND